MDRRFLGYYERELKHVREMGGEFARQFPKVAGRLGLDAFGSVDPYVERLIEAFAFLTARIQHRLGAAHAEFTQNMLELLYPCYLAPTPSMAIMQFAPNLRQSSLVNGMRLPRGSALRSPFRGNQTACEYRTGLPVTLWPFEIESAEYRTRLGELTDVGKVRLPEAQAALRIVLRAERSVCFDKLSLDTLPLFLRGGGDTATQLYEQLLTANIGMVVQSVERPVQFISVRRSPSVKALGFEENEALLPVGNHGFDGYRLLQEFFAFPERFMFTELRGLHELTRRANSSRIELLLLFDKADPRLDGIVRASHFGLYCTPAINLFPRTGDRIQLDERENDFHIVPDRTRPLDFEVHSVTAVHGHAAENDARCEFLPMYAPVWEGDGKRGRARYALRRQARPLKPGKREREHDTRFPYVPSEVYLSLVDGEHGAFRPGLRQLSVDTLCTNRALPLSLAMSMENLEFTEQSQGAVGVRCIAGPTPPRVSPVFGELAWSFLSHLSLDYLALMRRDGAGAAALQQMLGLYANFNDQSARLQVNSIVDVQAQMVVRALARNSGPLTYGRGVEITITCDENAFEGTGAVLMGAVLERFFTKYASINAFVETVLRTQQRGQVMRWSARPGQRSIL
jgi:type VI secretion system protein ImpG